MKIKKILLSIFLFLIPLTVEAASTVSVDVSSSQSTVIVGDTFYVYVEAESSNILGTYQYDISYNSKLLKLVSFILNLSKIFLFILLFFVSFIFLDKKTNIDFKINILCSIGITILLVCLIFLVLLIVEKKWKKR